MVTVKELFEKFNVDLDLEEYVLNHDICDNINYVKEYFQETRNGEKIYVFRGNPEETSSYFEYIINPKDKEESGAVSITFLGYTDDKYDTAVAFNKEVFGKDGITTEMNM